MQITTYIAVMLWLDPQGWVGLLVKETHDDIIHFLYVGKLGFIKDKANLGITIERGDVMTRVWFNI